jgi:hypothetical protein
VLMVFVSFYHSLENTIIAHLCWQQVERIISVLKECNIRLLTYYVSWFLGIKRRSLSTETLELETICFISRYFTSYWLQWQTDNYTIWQTWWFWFCNRQLFLFYGVICHFCLLWCVYLPIDTIRKSMFCVRGLFKTMQTTDK